MIRCVKYYADNDFEGHLIIEAENQRWDKSTLEQLREEYGIIFKSEKYAHTPVKVLRDCCGLYRIVLGSEYDGTIQFEQCGSGEQKHYKHALSSYWIDELIADLQAAKSYIAELEANDEAEKAREGK